MKACAITDRVSVALFNLYQSRYLVLKMDTAPSTLLPSYTAVSMAEQLPCRSSSTPSSNLLIFTNLTT